MSLSSYLLASGFRITVINSRLSIDMNCARILFTYNIVMFIFLLMFNRINFVYFSNGWSKR